MPGPPAPCSYGLAAVLMGYVIWTASNLQNGQLNRYDGDSWGVVRPLEPWNTVNTSLSGLQRWYPVGRRVSTAIARHIGVAGLRHWKCPDPLSPYPAAGSR